MLLEVDLVPHQHHRHLLSAAAVLNSGTNDSRLVRSYKRNLDLPVHGSRPSGNRILLQRAFVMRLRLCLCGRPLRVRGHGLIPVRTLLKVASIGQHEPPNQRHDIARQLGKRAARIVAVCAQCQHNQITRQSVRGDITTR